MSGTAPRGRRWSGRLRGDRGAAAAEFAVVMPALVLVLSLVLTAAAIGLTQLRAADAARAGAREAARGEAVPAVVAAAKKRAGAGASARVVQDAGYARVDVRIALPPPLASLRRSVSASAEARLESQGARARTGVRSSSVPRGPA